VINSSSSSPPSDLLQIIWHSKTKYTGGGSYFFKYYSIAFAILTRIAGGLAQELP
jgi:hypothetical protein